MGWETSTRQHPPGWKALRRQVLERAEHTCQAPNCLSSATDVDHIVNLKSGGSHELDNLQALCKPCHTKKTLQEARAARQRFTTARPREKHPGLTEG